MIIRMKHYTLPPTIIAQDILQIQTYINHCYRCRKAHEYFSSSWLYLGFLSLVFRRSLERSRRVVCWSCAPKLSLQLDLQGTTGNYHHSKPSCDQSYTPLAKLKDNFLVLHGGDHSPDEPLWFDPPSTGPEASLESALAESHLVVWLTFFSQMYRG